MESKRDASFSYLLKWSTIIDEVVIRFTAVYLQGSVHIKLAQQKQQYAHRDRHSRLRYRPNREP